MKATFPWLAAVLAVALAVPAARAQSFDPRFPPSCFPPQAPDCCGPCFYAQNCYGAYYGPNYYLYPGFPPFNGMLAPWGAGAGAGGPSQLGSPGFPTHPWARSPRDFFMVDAPSSP